MNKVEQILRYLKSKGIDTEERRGVFFSLFRNNTELITSKGVLYTEKTIKENIKEFLVKREKGSYLVIDIVKDIVELSNVEQIKNIDIRKEGIAIYSDTESKLGVLLPNTVGVNDIKGAISYVLKKENIESRNVIIYKFTTNRFVIGEN